MYHSSSHLPSNSSKTSGFQAELSSSSSRQLISMEVLAGSASAGFAYGAGAAAQFHSPYGVAVDGEGNIIIADSYNNRVRKLTPDGTVSTLAGSGSKGFADGAGAAAQFDCPYGVAVDGKGNIIIADSGNRRVRKLTPDGTVSTLAVFGSYGFGTRRRSCALRYPSRGCRGWRGQHHHGGQGQQSAQDHTRRHREHARGVRKLAFCMLSHERLGHGSIWAGLEQGLLQMVLCKKH
jgi:hypothetical protein